MPKRRETKELYRRGAYWLAWDRDSNGAARSPYLTIFWYDPERRRERSVSTRTVDLAAAKLKLDAHYLKNERGAAICPTCGQPKGGARDFLIADAISNHIVLRADARTSGEAIRARHAHTLSYLETLPNIAVTCGMVDEDWIEGFRAWAVKQPIVSSGGKERTRALGTVEASVRMLAAAINLAHARGDAMKPAQFKPLAPREVSRTPQHRATIDQLSAMFAYVLDKSRKKRSEPLHRFLIASVATVARPDAVLDISTKPDRGQWISDRKVLHLNPKGRRQTKKHRATVRAPWQFACWLDADAEAGGKPFVPVASVKHAWSTMAKRLGLPMEGEAGLKLIRRSIGQLLRDRGVPDTEIEVQMGHRTIGSTTDLYAGFRPEHLANATKAIETLIDDIEARVPGAFYRTGTGQLPNVIPFQGGLSA